MTTIDRLPLIEIEQINDLLDRYRASHNLTSDEKLGHHLGVSGQAIYRWRRGEIDRSARALATIVLQLLDGSVDIAA
jgi:DNA-binding XRE family transcriptional regulator